MKNMDVSSWTDDELMKKKSSVKMSTMVLGVGVVLFFAVLLFISLREQKVSWTIILPISFIPILLHNRGWLKTIDEEMEKRKV